MPKKKGNQFPVDTQPTKKALVDSLTRDISAEACLFDLIDNSVDSARETLQAANPDTQPEEQPESYDGFKIDLKFSGDSFSISDNCGGITKEKLQTMALRFGAQSDHPGGIGIFGLGLNRAIFKLGKVSHLKSDTGKQRVELVLNADQYLKAAGWKLPAEEFASSGKIGTTVEISRLHSDIGRRFGDDQWVDEYCRSVGRRYGRFIQKGLTITVNGTEVPDGEVQLRQGGPFPEEYKFYKVGDVTVHIRIGQHAKHRFTAEPDYLKENNAPLTKEFGWTVLCNDRAIVMSDQSTRTGWDTKFHSEFYGFVGIVSFDAENPASLPWDTTKFDLDLNNAVYQQVLVDMRKFAELWRTNANMAKSIKRKGEELLPLPQEKADAEEKPKAASKSATVKKSVSKAVKKPVKKADHNQFGTLLPDDIDEGNCNDKFLALVHEAKNLNLAVPLSYSGMALLRLLIETTIISFYNRKDMLEDLRDFAFEERKRNARPGFEVKKENVSSASLDEMFTFMEQNPDTWCKGVKQKFLRDSFRKMVKDKKVLNGISHNPFQTIHLSAAFTIRDNALPVLRHLIES